MKRKILVLIGVAWSSLISTINPVLAQGTAFTYQGRLNTGTNPASGSFDLAFAVFDAATNGSQQGVTVTNTATSVSGGLFTVSVDFGNQFPGADRWLEIGVRTNGGGAFATLTPRQLLAPTPYSITARNLASGTSLSGTFSSPVTFNNSSNSISGSFAGNGSNLTNVNAATLGGISAGNFWQTGGNPVAPGQFLGSTNFTAVEIWAGGLRGWRLAPTVNDANHSNIVNVIGGSPVNLVSNGVYGATIGGGGSASYLGNTGGGNTVTGDFGTIAGGRGNTIGPGSYAGTIGGGAGNNAANGIGATVAGGQANSSTNDYSTISGGLLNQSYGYASALGGGLQNLSSNDLAAVGGGRLNKALGVMSTISGGYGNTASGTGAFVGGGGFDGSTYSGNTASGVGSFVGGGLGNTAQNTYSATGGGASNTNAADYGSIGGGYGNTATGAGSVIGGGGSDGINFHGNIAGGTFSTIGGGYANSTAGYSYASVVPGGISNTASGSFSFAAGQQATASQTGAFVWSDAAPYPFDPYALAGPQGVANSFNVRATGGFFVASSVNGSGSISTFMALKPNGNLVLSGGNLGIGNSNPFWPVDVSASQAVARLNTTSAANGSVLELDSQAVSPTYYGAINFNQGAGQIAYLANGDLAFRTSGSDQVRITAGGNVGIGTASPSSKLQVNGNAQVCTLTITGGCDLSEPFAVSAVAAPKGAVMVIDPKNPGKLEISQKTYDHRVAGIISGANGINPAISMQQDGLSQGGQNVALSGRVYALADATQEPIEPGDLLTTSGIPGHCMKATDHVKAQGAILGKAMSSLAGGKGMVLVLVCLQ